VKITVFWNMTQCSLVNFGGTWCLCLHDTVNTDTFMLMHFILMRAMQMMMDAVVKGNVTRKEHAILTYRVTSKNHKRI
jgi:hypothetical protein